MRNYLQKLALPAALAASVAGCATLKGAENGAARNCPENFRPTGPRNVCTYKTVPGLGTQSPQCVHGHSKPVEGACLSTRYNALGVLRAKCANGFKNGGVLIVAPIENGAPTWACSSEEGSMFW